MSYLNLSPRQKITITALLYILWVVGFTYFSVMQEKKELYQALDRQLEDAAIITTLLLPSTLHHQGMHKHDQTQLQDTENMLSLSYFTDNNDIIYLYTLVLRDDKVLFTSSSATEEERESGEMLSSYFDHYDDVDPGVYDIFNSKEKAFLEYTDQWGTFRSVFLPSYSEDGTFYLAGADLSISHIQALLNQQTYRSLVIAILFLLFVYPIYLAATFRMKNIAEELDNKVRAQTSEIFQKEKRLNHALTSAHQSWFDANLITGELNVSDGFSKILKYDPENFKINLQKWKDNIHYDDQDWILAEFDNCLKTGGPVTGEYRLRAMDGSWPWIHTVSEVVEWDENGNPTRMTGIHRDITKRKRSNDVLRTLAETGASEDGNIFKTIVRQLAKSHDMRYAFIACINRHDSTQADIIALWANGEFGENFSYSLLGTPCSDVVDATDIGFYPDNIQQQFPDDHLLVEMGAESYIGIPLKNTAGKTLGLIAMLDDKPMSDTDGTIDLLKSLATRASIELERILFETERKQTEISFKERQQRLLQHQQVLLALTKENFTNTKEALDKIVTIDAEQLDVARASIWLFNDDHTTLICQALYQQGKLSTEMLTLESKDYPNYFKVLNESGFISANDAQNHPMTAEFTEGYFIPLSITSILETPIRVKGEIIGITCRENIGPQKKWTIEDEDFAKSISDLAAQIFLDERRAKAEQALNQMAHYDVLTRLPNRTLFSDRFKQATAHAKRTETMLAICFLDLDNFKPVNDNHGHEVGDQLLIEVANRLQDTIREEDTASRQGGDEFALLLRDIESFAQCEQLLERIRNTLAQPYLIDGYPHKISVSIGTTIYPLDDADLDTLLRHADQAMYQAKLAGKDQQQLFNALDDQQIAHKQTQQQEIKQALANKQFQLYYQPKVNMKTGQVFGMEALIRWIHPEKGLIPPLDFLPVIEGTDLEIQIGGWVINEALQQLDNWQQQGIKLEVSINISSHHLQSAVFFDQLNSGLEKHPDVDSQNLQLEILESSALGDLNAISGIIKSCQNVLGVNVALDDFGTGYSSLTHMKSLTAGTIKIDQTFVRDLLDDPNDYSIIEGIIGLAKAFNREVIAEGVETDAHGLMLLIMGCNEAQGYGISRPIPAADIPPWLTNYTPNQYWVSYGKQELSLQQHKIILLQLTTEHWFDNVNKSLLTMEDSGFGRYFVKCHLGVWLVRFEQENMFDQIWLKDLKQAHDVLFSLATELIKKHQNGEIVQAKAGLEKLKSTYNKVQSILHEHTHSTVAKQAFSNLIKHV